MRLTAGSWSWVSLAASFARFDADFEPVSPPPLSVAFEHRQRAEPMGPSAEALLDELGLWMFTEDWWLDVDGERMQVLTQEVRRDRVDVAPSLEGAIAKSAEMRASVELLLPTDRLHQEDGPC